MQVWVEDKINWGVLQRFIFIEQQLLWGRCFKARMLMKKFDVSRHQASIDIKNYIEQYPSNIKPYNPQKKYYEPSDDFYPQLAGIHYEYAVRNALVNANDQPAIETCPVIKRDLHDKTVMAIMRHIETGQSFEVIYASARNPAGTARVLTPSRIIFASGRLHLVAYCHTRQSYRDFALSRFMSVPKTVEKPLVDIPEEHAEILIFELKVNPALSPEGRQLVEKEFASALSNLVQTRASLLHYFLQENNLPADEDQLKHAEEHPWSYPLLAALSQSQRSYLFGA